MKIRDLLESFSTIELDDSEEAQELSDKSFEQLEHSSWVDLCINELKNQFSKKYPGVDVFFKSPSHAGSLFATTDKSNLETADIKVFGDRDDTKHFDLEILGTNVEIGMDKNIYCGLVFTAVNSGPYRGIVMPFLAKVVPILAKLIKAKPAIMIGTQDLSLGAWEAIADKLRWPYINEVD